MKFHMCFEQKGKNKLLAGSRQRVMNMKQLHWLVMKVSQLQIAEEVAEARMQIASTCTAGKQAVTSSLWKPDKQSEAKSQA
jgi:hypothetical protein